MGAFTEGFKKSPVGMSLIGIFALACVTAAVIDAIKNPVDDEALKQKTQLCHSVAGKDLPACKKP